MHRQDETRRQDDVADTHSSPAALPAGRRILVIGASQGIGLATCKAALSAGFRVRGFARNIDRSSLHHPDFEAVRADALNEADVAEALRGCDAVVQTLGIKADPATLINPVTLFSRATDVLLPAMRAADVARLVTVTGYGVGDSRRALPLPERLLFEAVMGRVAADKERQESAIRASDTQWTILRPGFLTLVASCPAARLRADPADWRNGFVSRNAVADAIVDLLRGGGYLHKAVVFT
ncbi:NAD(P)-dependent oxidoreductase [Saliniramus sp.]|uniref:NAD(P)-dependent oxidoreductase n=1 Tax=Saliniramus sp. TaxID=2986772 RepID=UPI002CA17E7F|nr:SDR family NAD(P)-dependent oxidoreductase [Saliniramus sp.]HMB10915.1 SDR family NAD(P)-dependent oxidoreductase [Saliniramus sp.]